MWDAGNGEDFVGAWLNLPSISPKPLRVREIQWPCAGVGKPKSACKLIIAEKYSCKLEDRSLPKDTRYPMKAKMVVYEAFLGAEVREQNLVCRFGGHF
jgi:hypothetical protein